MRRLPQPKFDGGKATGLQTAKIQLDFIVTNLHHLRKVDKNGSRERAALEFKRDLDAGLELSPNKLSYIDSIYESTMRGAEYPSVGLHVDKKRTGLKFGR